MVGLMLMLRNCARTAAYYDDSWSTCF